MCLPLLSFGLLVVSFFLPRISVGRFFVLIKILTLLDRRIRLKFSHASLEVSFLKMTDNTSFVAFCRQQVTKILPTQNQKFLQTLRRDHELYLCWRVVVLSSD